jgi:hypothetical protein
MRTNLAVLTAMIALAGGVAACSTSATNSSSQSSAAPKSGTETIYGKITGGEAAANNPAFPLTFTGPVNTTGKVQLGNQPSKGSSQTFPSQAGDLVLTVTSAGTNTGGLTSTKTCQAAFTTTVPFTVDGAKSTGKFAGSSGSGKAVVVFSGEMPKLSSGQCNQSQNAQPIAKTAAATFKATTPLTLKG